MYDPSAVFYMEKLVTGAAAAPLRRHRRTGRSEHRRRRQGQGLAHEDVTVVVLDRPRHDQLGQRDPRGWRADQVHPRRRRRRRHHGRSRRHRRRPAARHRRHARGHHRGVRREVPRRRHPGQALAAGRGRAHQGARRRPRPRRGADDRRPGASDNVFFVATGITDGELVHGVRYAAPARVTSSLVMRSKSGTIRTDRERAPAVEAARVRDRRLRPPARRSHARLPSPH